MCIIKAYHEDVSWVPYDNEILQRLSPLCFIHERYWMSTTILINYVIMKMYHPNRVMRQFGKYQVIPPLARSTLRLLYVTDYQKFSKKNSIEYHRDFIS